MSVYQRTDVVIAGAGIIGLTTAWLARRAGLQVTLIDPTPTRGSSYAAAGMLAPISSSKQRGHPVAALNLLALQRWPAFVEQLFQVIDTSIGYRPDGTLTVGVSEQDELAVRDLHTLEVEMGIPTSLLNESTLREYEPGLASSMTAGLWSPEDHSVNNRRLLQALLTACERSGVTLIRARGTLMSQQQGAKSKVTGVKLADGRLVEAAWTVLAAGAWSHNFPGVPTHVAIPVRPVRGQILRLADSDRGESLLPKHTIRGFVNGRHIYLVPREDGELAVGATADEPGFDPRVTAGGVYQLLHDAHQIYPALTDFEFIEAWSSLRPATPDHGPLLGQTTAPGLLLATGHFHYGILQAPLTGEAIVQLIQGIPLDPVIAAFDPKRFVVE